MGLAIYPGTFDPITRGHLDVAERVARLFDRVLIAVAASRPKRPRLSVEDRVALACEALHHVPNVQVEAFDGLIATFAAHRGASVLIRGLRTIDNLSDEAAMAVTNRRMIPGLETMFVPSSTIFVFASENNGGRGLIASAVVTSAKAVAKKRGIIRQTPRVSITIRRTALAKQRLGRSELRPSSDRSDGGPESELNFKFYRQATNKIVGISDDAAAFRRDFF
jgi:pantetheine-phosphate adenylyltransferase